MKTNLWLVWILILLILIFPLINVLTYKKNIKNKQNFFTSTYCTIISICRLCINLFYFKFSNNYDKKKFGLPMGSPRRSCLACLFLESFESGPFQYVLPKNSYLRCIDDVLIIHQKNIDIKNINTQPGQAKY